MALAPALPDPVEAATGLTLAASASDHVAVNGPGASRRLVDAVVMLVVAALSLGLLLYVALGEARKTYPAFQVEKMQAQGALVQTSIEGFLLAGLPIAQLPGFTRLADTIRASDPDIAAIVVRDAGGRLTFAVGEQTAFDLPRDAAVGADDSWLWVTLPLDNRFATVGSLMVVMPQSAIAESIAARGAPVAGAVLMIGAGFGMMLVMIGRMAPARRWRWAAIGYGACFTLAVAAVVFGLVQLYADGAQARARALTETLGQRIAPLVDYGLDIEDVSGLPETLAQYRALNPDILGAGVIIDGVVAAHSDRDAVGSAWRSSPGAYDYAAPVGALADAAVSVAVSLPSHVVWRAAARSVKNFAALALASALLAALFFGVARAVSDLSARTGPVGDPRALALARPIFFVAVFADSLSAGFLPQLLREAADAAGAGPQAASLAFTGYFVAFMLALLPATAWIGRVGARLMIVGGALLIALAGAAPALVADFHVLVLARVAAGIGQGALFVGVQAAVSAAAAPGQRTTVAAIMVFGFSGGMISGAAIGALLFQDIGASGVFATSATVGLLLALYATRVARRRAAPAGTGLIGLLRAAPAALAGWRFGSGLLLVGAPSKAVMTGVVVFALPLMLYDRGWSADDIGQVVMLYGAGVLAISGPVARAVDRSRGVARDGRLALMAGGALSAIALLLIGAPQSDSLIGALTIAGGALLLGLAHGCVNAPVVTFASSGVDKAGPDGTGALYRVVERVGHVAGPGVAAAVILWAGSAGAGLMMLAAAIAACTGMFAIMCGVKR